MAASATHGYPELLSTGGAAGGAGAGAGAGAGGGAGASALETVAGLIARAKAAGADNAAAIAAAEAVSEVRTFKRYVSRTLTEAGAFVVTETATSVSGESIRAGWKSGLTLAPMLVPWAPDLKLAAATLAEVKALNAQLVQHVQGYALFGNTDEARGEVRKFVANLTAIGEALTSLAAQLREAPSEKAALEAKLAEAAAIARAAIEAEGAVLGEPVSDVPPSLAAMGVTPAHMVKLREWVAATTGTAAAREWREEFRASRDGWDGGLHFHARCDGKPRLLVIIRIAEGGWLCGGFTSTGFERVSSDYIRKPDAGAFIFTLTNPHGTEPTMLRPTLKPDQAVSHVTGAGGCAGPAWGSNHDLYVYNNANVSNGVFCCLNGAYADTTGKGAGLFHGAAGAKLAADYAAFTV